MRKRPPKVRKESTKYLSIPKFRDRNRLCFEVCRKALNERTDINTFASCRVDHLYLLGITEFIVEGGFPPACSPTLPRTPTERDSR